MGESALQKVKIVITCLSASLPVKAKSAKNKILHLSVSMTVLNLCAARDPKLYEKNLRSFLKLSDSTIFKKI